MNWYKIDKELREQEMECGMYDIVNERKGNSER